MEGVLAIFRSWQQSMAMTLMLESVSTLWKAQSIIRNIIKILYHIGNINIVSYHKHFEGAYPFL